MAAGCVDTRQLQVGRSATIGLRRSGSVDALVAPVVTGLEGDARDGRIRQREGGSIEEDRKSWERKLCV